MSDDTQFTQGFQGAAGGAMAGGSMGGPAGAAIGGGIGLLAGLFGNQGAGAYQDQLKQLAAQYGSRQAPGMAATAQAGDSQFRADQAFLVSQLQSMAAGSGPSAAALQMRQAMDRAAAAQASAVAGAGGRGVNQGAAQRNASNNTAALQQGIAGQTAMARVQEQLGAIQNLGGVLQGARGQDIGLSQFNAAQQNAMAQFGAQLQMQQEQLNQSGQLQALLAAMGAAGPGLGSQIMAGGAQMMPGAMQMGGAAGKGGGGGGLGGGSVFQGLGDAVGG